MWVRLNEVFDEEHQCDQWGEPPANRIVLSGSWTWDIAADDEDG